MPKPGTGINFTLPEPLQALAADAAELLEIFQWLTDEQSREIVNDEKELALVREEIAHVMIYLVRLADKLGVDIEKAVKEKIEVNEKKYPVKLSKGKIGTHPNGPSRRGGRTPRNLPVAHR